MSIRVQIDVTHERVVLGDSPTREFRGQWVAFYGLLALRAESATDAAFLAAEELGRFDRWQHKVPASIGKEVSRHLSRLDADGLAGLVGHRGKTRQWRLQAADVSMYPTRDAVAQWLEDRRAPPAVPALGALGTLVQATLALHAGRTEQAMQAALDSVPEGANDAAWRAVVAGRAAQRTDEGDQIQSLHDELESRGGAAVRAARARLAALGVYDQRYFDPAERLVALRGLAGRLEAGGDVGSLGAVLNVMGLLARRAARPEEGAGHLRRACSLFGLCGDMGSLQAALFNLALCRSDVLQRRSEPPDDDAMELIDLCLAICSSFGVGRDSAQAEITGCRWSLHRGEVNRARSYLDEARRIVEVLPSDFEHACFLRARAELALATSDPNATPVKDLHVALRLFTRLGDEFMVKRVRRQLALLGE